MRKAKILTFILALTLVFSMAINASAAANLAKDAKIVEACGTVNAATEGPERLIEEEVVTQLGQQEGWSADRDEQIGKYLTKWCCVSNNGCSVGTGVHHIIIDLGAAKNFDSYLLATGNSGARDAGDGNAKYIASDFELFISNNENGPWESVDKVTGNSNNKYEKNFGVKTARYVKVELTNPVQPGEGTPTVRAANLSIFEAAATSTPEVQAPTEAPTQAPTQAPTSAPTSGGSSGKESANNTADGFTFVYIALAVLAMGAVVTISRTRKNNA